MITRINNLQSPFFGQKLKRNAAIEYEEDGNICIRVFFSQKQGLEILNRATDSSPAHVNENDTDSIYQCGLPGSSAQEPVTIRGSAARVLHCAREAVTATPIAFASDSRKRVLIFLKTFKGTDAVCILFVIDEIKARHLYIVHGRNEARSVLEKLQKIGSPGSHELRLEQIEASELAERSKEPTLHIEHDAASYLGMHIECFWMLLMAPTSKHLPAAQD